MKKITVLLVLLCATFTFAQQGINYKAIIKDGGGNVVASTAITVQFIILEGTTNVYEETHTPTTDTNGIIILNIGDGTTSDVFANIDWAIVTHFLNTQIDIGSGLTDMGTTPFMAVPYALHATTAENIFSGDYNDLTNQPTTPTYIVNTFYAELGGYVIEVRNGGKHGLVVAMQDQGSSSWYASNDLPNDASNHDANGANFMDWRLPTKRELDLMYINKVSIGGFTMDFYWSSTELNTGTASGQRFNGVGAGAQFGTDRSTIIDVRAVRVF